MRKFIIIVTIIAAILTFNSCDNDPVPCRNCGADVDAEYAHICAIEGASVLCEECR